MPKFPKLHVKAIFQRKLNEMSSEVCDHELYALRWK